MSSTGASMPTPVADPVQNPAVPGKSWPEVGAPAPLSSHTCAIAIGSGTTTHITLSNHTTSREDGNRMSIGRHRVRTAAPPV